MTNIYAQTSHDDLTLQELALYKLIMDYRATAGLSAIPLSRALTITAGRHALDTRDNIWAAGLTLPEGTNLHSWSDAPYYGDHRAPDIMWKAPQRLGTEFTGNGYEISAAGQPDISAALEGWKGSSGHNNIIMNLEGWERIDFKSIGIGVETSAGAGAYGGRIYHVWFSDTADSAAPVTQDTAASEVITATGFADIINNTGGSDLIRTEGGDDVVRLGGSGTYGPGFVALNASSAHQVGTGVRLDLDGRVRHDEVTDGGAGVDVIELTEGNDAFFLHDSFSAFHSGVALVRDSNARDTAARIIGIEEIRGGAGHDIIDLTSPDLTVGTITLRGGTGNDVLWDSHNDSQLFGDAGNDVLFGGAGVTTMTGGADADTFEFTRSSTQTTITDFNPGEGDRLRVYRPEGTQLDAGSVTLSGDALSVGMGNGASITITLQDTQLTLEQITGALDFV